MHIAIDAVGIRGHGGAAVLCELLQWLPRIKPEWSWHVFMLERNLREFDDPEVSENVYIESTSHGNSGLERLKWIREYLPEKLYQTGADLVFSFANIGNPNPFLPQVVFCHQPNAFFLDGIPRQAVIKKARLLFMRNRILQGALASQAIIVQTEAMQKKMMQLEPALMDKIHVIPSGYRTPSDNLNIRNEKKSLIDNSTQPRLIYVSHPSEHKNHLSLIKALPHIIKSVPSASLLLTLEKENHPNRRYSSFINELLYHARNLGVEKNIVWLGILNSDEVSYTLSCSKLSVFPSLAESFGLGLVESFAAGCPVAGADLSYVHNTCNDAAVYFDPQDPEDIANTLINTCNDKNKIEKLKQIGKQYSEKFSYKVIAQNFIEIFEQAVQINNEVYI
jgi:glycosyltransferase involved in cell wall biosynthesis